LVQAVVTAISRAIRDPNSGRVLRAMQQMVSEMKSTDPVSANEIQAALSKEHGDDLAECGKQIAYYHARQAALQDLLGVTQAVGVSIARQVALQEISGQSR
jgi:hypothetical protein